MSLVYPVRLRSVEAFIREVHGSDRALTATEILTIDEYAGAMLDDIQDAWPVDTSTSRDAWTYDLEESPGDIRITFSNDTYYVQYVHLSGEDEPLWESLVPSVVQRYASDLLLAVRADILATEREIARNQAFGGRGLVDIIARRPEVFRVGG